jgi:cytochrome P450
MASSTAERERVHRAAHAQPGPEVPRITAAETAGVLADVVAPLIGRGVIARRPRVVGLLDRLNAERRGVRRLQTLRARYDEGPVLLRIPGRNVALILSAPDLLRVLEGSPEPFATANVEKQAALATFQPHGVLISHGPERAERRRWSEQVLETPSPVHSLAQAMLAKLREEAGQIAEQARTSGSLSWDAFALNWWRAVRRIVLGDAARDDNEITDLLARLRADANWAQLAPRRRGVQKAFLDRLGDYLRRGEPGSLASVVRSVPGGPEAAPAEQVPHWLFAFDAAGMASFRTLALLDAHPEHAAQARTEIDRQDLTVSHELPFLRACVLDSLRLWPTTPAVLRDTTTVTAWRNGILPAGSAVAIFAPFFHRDDQRLPFADAFRPDLWLPGGEAHCWPLIPFSDGSAECPGRNVVMLLTSSLLAMLLSQLDLTLASPAGFGGTDALPATLSPFRLHFLAARR